ncbi:MAG: helix-turn-helix transcriptional regulator [Myxococcota bacterium]
MRTDETILMKLHHLAEAAGADLAWVAEIADAGGTTCFGRVWVTPSYHPEAKRIRGFDGRAIPGRDHVLSPSTKALEGFVRDETGLSGSGDSLVHFHCRGLRVVVRVGLASTRGTIDARGRRAAEAQLPGLLESIKAPEVPEDGDLVLLFGSSGRILYIGGKTTRYQAWQGAVDRLHQVITEGGPAVLDGAAVSVQVLEGPDGPAHLATLRPAKPVYLSPEVLLTPTQREVAVFAADGATVREIADQLGRHVETVRSHLREAYRRLDVASRIDLARTLAGDMTPFVEELR